MLIGTALPALLQASILLTLTTLFRVSSCAKALNCFWRHSSVTTAPDSYQVSERRRGSSQGSRSALPLPVWLQ